MAEFTKLVLTTSGEALLAKVLAGEKIEFTQMRTSTDTYTEAELEQLTTLPDIVQTVDIESVSVVSDTEVELYAELTNETVTTEYAVGTVGVYAIDPDEGEILYAAASETSGRCYVEPYNYVSMARLFMELVVTVGNAESVYISVYETGYALKSEVLQVHYDSDAHSMVFTTGIK